MQYRQRENFPLTTRNSDDIFALIGPSAGESSTDLTVISVGQFLAHVAAMASRLPPQGPLLNLCETRYRFIVTFAAALVTRKTSILPPNRAEATLAGLKKKYGAHVFGDRDVDECLLANSEEGSLNEELKLGLLKGLDIPGDHVAAICFTSGSTGASKAIEKTWRTYACSTRINMKSYLPDSKEQFYELSTVSPGHMWGMETGVLLPLFARVAISDHQPLYPADVAAALARLPEPRILVSSPSHLRALVSSSVAIPSVARVLCATAPLSQTIAVQTERCTGGVLIEIYGCSEMGSMAYKRTSDEQYWRLFEGFKLEQTAGGRVRAFADHIEEATVLGDLLKLEPRGRFTILGRDGDLINIGGKRASLADLNQILLSCEDLDDGVMFEAASNAPNGRLAAMVVSPTTVSRQQLAEHFRKHVDSAFIPRSVIQVPALPRNENGKLSSQDVRSLYASLTIEKTGSS